MENNNTLYEFNKQCCDITNNIINKEMNQKKYIKVDWPECHYFEDKTKEFYHYLDGVTIFVEENEYNRIKKELDKCNKYNITNLKPFDKVLVRDENCFWSANFYSFYKKPYFMTTNGLYAQCIPYNDDTKYLLGTNKNCPEYYKTWE